MRDVKAPSLGPVPEPTGEHGADFEGFMSSSGGRLRQAFVARYGVEIGNEVANEAFVVAWERWSDVSNMGNPTGYLYRVGQSAARPYWRRRRTELAFPIGDGFVGHAGADVDVELFAALARLSAEQRTAVLLVHGHRYTYAEVSDVLGLPVTSVTNHVHRGMRRLRRLLGAHDG
jgi:DNA-directed RNA polymerase specialized sigma24 family protein